MLAGKEFGLFRSFSPSLYIYTHTHTHIKDQVRDAWRNPAIILSLQAIDNKFHVFRDPAGALSGCMYARFPGLRVARFVARGPS